MYKRRAVFPNKENDEREGKEIAFALIDYRTSTVGPLQQKDNIDSFQLPGFVLLTVKRWRCSANANAD